MWREMITLKFNKDEKALLEAALVDLSLYYEVRIVSSNPNKKYFEGKLKAVLRLLSKLWRE